MSSASRVFLVGGPDFHPVADQARRIIPWLGDGCRCALHDGVDAFEHLDGCDLLVLMGLHWTGMTDRESLRYRPMQGQHQRAFERYVASGRPVLAHHGAIASYDDWPRFRELIGVQWIWGTSTHSPIGNHAVRVTDPDHPVMAGVSDFEILDELYYNLTLADGMRVHATAHWAEADRPMVVTGAGGDRRTPGAGRVVYLANGHDLRAFETPAMRTLWTNAVRWLLNG